MTRLGVERARRFHFHLRSIQYSLGLRQLMLYLSLMNYDDVCTNPSNCRMYRGGSTHPEGLQVNLEPHPQINK